MHDVRCTLITDDYSAWVSDLRDADEISVEVRKIEDVSEGESTTVDIDGDAACHIALRCVIRSDDIDRCSKMSDVMHWW